MTQEDKDLILRDLCARLPYGVYINDRGTPNKLVNVCWDGIKFVVNCSPFGTGHGRVGTPLFDGDICYIKPYLRPLSSMTEEEARDLAILHGYYEPEILSVKVTEKYIDVTLDDGVCGTYTETIWYDEIWIISSIKCFDYLNKNMFDFRGLIPKDLALSTEIYNPYKK